MNKNGQHLHHRITRIKGFDYQQPGIYFVTLVVKDREQILGEILDGQAHLKNFGEIAEHTWSVLPAKFPGLTNEDYIIMPDHLHGLLTFSDTIIGGLPEVIRYFKSFSARRINHKRKCLGTAVWQRNYYEHIVRTDDELENIRQYILENPMRWELKNNPRRNS